MGSNSVKLPFIDVTASPEDAASALIDQACSALVVDTGAELRILDEEAIVRGLSLGVPSLSALMVSSAPVIDLAGRRPSRGFGIGGAFPMVDIDPSLISLRYLSGPRIARCENPVSPHYYPPTRRDDQNPNQCTLCPYPIS